MTRQSLSSAFGARNVANAEISAGEGATMPGTVLFPTRPDRRLEVQWTADAPQRPVAVRIAGRSAWRSGSGIALGDTLAALERRNGRPFLFTGFHDGGGIVSDWQGGALRDPPGPCRIGIRLAPDPKAPRAALRRVLGDGDDRRSDDRDIRAVSPRVVEIVTHYPD